MEMTPFSIASPSGCVGRICRPAPVREPPARAKVALAKMRILDRLYSACLAGEGSSCVGQAPHVDALRKLGWCSKTGPNRFTVPSVMWMRCTP